MDHDPIEELILAEGVNDWISPHEIVGEGVARGLDRKEANDLALGMIIRFVKNGWFATGDIENDVHVPWDLEPDAAIRRIISAWTSTDDLLLDPGDIVWLRLTPTGRSLGRSILEKWEERE